MAACFQSKYYAFLSVCIVWTLSTAVYAQQNNVRAFMDEEIECERYIFPPGAFPKIHWKNDALVESNVGKFVLTVTYFNNVFQKVSVAETTGRYGALIEGTTPAGFIIKRYVTLFCSTVEFDDYSRNVPVTMRNLSGYGISENKWKQYAHNEEHFSFGSLKYFPQRDPDAAIFLAGLNDLEDRNTTFDTPRIRDRQWWIALKRTLEGRTTVEQSLRVPAQTGNNPSILRSETAQSSPLYHEERVEALRTVCRTWAEKEGVPHVTLVVHHGKIIFHEAFGTDENNKAFAKDAMMWMASITKIVTGVLMMQCVDQGLVELDAPVGRYLPELNGKANDKLTVRQLFTHTTGLSFAGEWASDWNPALENQIAHVLPTVDVDVTFNYHRVGYALAGKILERITGRAVPYLFHEYVFAPLGMNTAYADNTYGGLYCSAYELALFGQVLLHKGTYNGCTLFSAQTFDKMLPRKLPFGDRSWGIGISLYGGHGLGDAAFGHGAASGTIFRIDPNNDLIIISARNSPGKKNDEYANALIERCTALVVGF